jgi:molybdopterin molybdotransferase
VSGRDVSAATAIALAREAAPSPGEELVPLELAAGRLLSAAVVARIDLPPTDQSAMDGYAVRAADTPGLLSVAGESRAGVPSATALPAGSAAVVSTGAVIPPGADAVVRQEETAERDGMIDVERRLPPGRDVRRRGEVIAAGAELLPAGTRLAPHALGAVGAVGHARVPCRRRPRVVLIATGSELAPLGATLREGQIYDASRVGIAAQIAAAGGDLLGSVSVPDRAADTLRAIRDALELGIDLLVTAGGISRGRHDHVRAALAEVGFDTRFERMRARPCQPTWLGVRGRVAALGLPGNAVSAAVAMHVVGRPLLGLDEPWSRAAPLAAPVESRVGRAEFVRCAWDGAGLLPHPDQDSHAVTGLAPAEALAWIPEEPERLETGERVAWSALG